MATVTIKVMAKVMTKVMTKVMITMIKIVMEIHIRKLFIFKSITIFDFLINFF